MGFSSAGGQGELQKLVSFQVDVSWKALWLIVQQHWWWFMCVWLYCCEVCAGLGVGDGVVVVAWMW